MLCAKWVLLALGESYFSNAVTLLYVLAISNLPRGINRIYLGLLRVRDRLNELIIIRGLIAVAVPALTFVAIPVYDILGVGYVWLGVQGVVSIVLVLRLPAQLKRLSSSARGNR